MRNILESINIVSGFVPVDMQTTANTGDFVDLGEYGEVIVVLFKGIGTAGDDPVITIQEATTAAGGGAQNLACIETAYSKVGTQTGIGQWTKTTQAAAATYVDTTSAEAQALIAIRVRGDQLSEGYRYINASVADVGGNAQLGCLFYLCGKPSYTAELLSSAID